jgi:mannosylglycerate hydrolase
VAEPWALCAEGAERTEIARYFELAWRYLIQNHPHDSICGCSIDQVHQDMLYRFDQSLQISTRVAAEATAAIHAALQPPAEGEHLITVFNPSPFERHGVLLDVEFPDSAPAAFALSRRDGTPVPYQHVSTGKRMKIMRPYRSIPSGSLRVVQQVYADCTVPALGYATLAYRSVPVHERPAAEGSLSPEPNVLENDLIRLTFQPDGTVTLVDLETGEVYPRLHVFEDRGDRGDGWNYVPPGNDRVVTGLSGVSVAVTVDGPSMATAVVTGTLTVPARLTPDKGSRSEEVVLLHISSAFTLRRGSRRVDVSTEIDNSARDHVIKILFPARVTSRESFADSMFDIVRREIRLPSNAGYGERWQENRPLWSFVGISDPRRGLAVFAKGLHEGGVRDDTARSVFLTLLRCFERTVLTLGEEGGQLLGRQRLEYAFMPVREGEKAPVAGAVAPVAGALLRENDLYQNPVLYSSSLDVLKRDADASLRDTHSFLEISDPRVVLSSLRRNPSGERVLRVFNPTPDPVTVDITFGFPVSQVWQTDLEEARRGSEIALSGNQIVLTIAPKKVLSLLLGED